MYEIVQLNNLTLSEMWSRAAERVEALQRIDSLKCDIQEEYHRGECEGKRKMWDEDDHEIFASTMAIVRKRRYG
jgi:hypothetical protein